MNPRISMITLGVKDMAKSVAFYKDGLGFPQMASPPKVAFFTLNGSWLGLYDYKNLAEDTAGEISADDKIDGFKGFTLAHNVASEGEVDRIITHALSAGGVLSKAAQKTAWGGYSGYFKDPDGYLWEVAHNPFFWVGPLDE
ncbi:MAG: VOC family protein [Porticoccaceae bacterium]|nr:VOC family protein [Porticoccaceae bacterium]